MSASGGTGFSDGRDASVARSVLQSGGDSITARSSRRRICGRSRDRPCRRAQRLRGRAHRAAGGGGTPTAPVRAARRGPPARRGCARPQGDTNRPRAAGRARPTFDGLTWFAERSSGSRRQSAPVATSNKAPATRSSSRPTSSSGSAPCSCPRPRRARVLRASDPRSRSRARRHVCSWSRRRSSIRRGSVDRREDSTRRSSEPSTRRSCSSSGSRQFAQRPLRVRAAKQPQDTAARSGRNVALRKPRLACGGCPPYWLRETGCGDKEALLALRDAEDQRLLRNRDRDVLRRAWSAALSRAVRGRRCVDCDRDTGDSRRVAP